MRILLAEDEPTLQQIITNKLKKEGYSVDTASNGNEALDCLRSAAFDCIVLDIMMPGLDGISVLKAARSEGINTPVLLLTAMAEVEDRVTGLDAGADDYLTKPFSFEELTARIRSLLRRNSDVKTNVLQVADLMLDTATHRVCRGNDEIELATKEYAVLEYMMRNKGQVLSRNQIAEHVWNYDFECESNIIDVYIRILRSKIDDKYELKLIKTLRNRGYSLRESE